MTGKQPRRPVQAGETRSLFGHALDQLLPLPAQRKAFRRWRHTRPFWAGVLVILGGLVIISYPFGPLPAVMVISADTFTGIAIGLILVIGGLFLWFAPHQRMFVSIVLMLVSIVSLVQTNLGGWFAGMILGMAGSAMGFGWQPGGDYLRKGAAAVAAIGVLLASVVAYGHTAEPALAQQRWPSTGCGSTPVNAATLKGQVTVVETETLPVQGGCPPVEVITIYIHQATLTDYHLQSPRTRTGEVLDLRTDLRLENTWLFATRLHADIKLGGLLGLDLPIEPALPTGAVPITPQLVDTLGTLGVTPLRLKLDATNASLGQPLVLSTEVKLTDFSLRVVPGPTIGIGPRSRDVRYRPAAASG